MHVVLVQQNRTATYIQYITYNNLKLSTNFIIRILVARERALRCDLPAKVECVVFCIFESCSRQRCWTEVCEVGWWWLETAMSWLSWSIPPSCIYRCLAKSIGSTRRHTRVKALARVRVRFGLKCYSKSCME